MSQNPSLFLLPADKKFNGSNWASFKTTITEAARGCSLLGYLTGTITAPSPDVHDSKPTPATAWWGATNPTPDEWLQRDAFARSMVTLNVVNPVGAGVKLDGTAADAWLLLVTLNDAKSDLALIHAKEALASVKYTDGSSIEAHFKVMRTAWLRANDQGAGIDDRRFRVYVIKSML